MTHILHRHLHVTPPVAVAGRGMYVRDSAGRGYLDACGGGAVSCLGHRHPDVLAAMQAQIDSLAYKHTGFFTSQPAEAIADAPTLARAAKALLAAYPGPLLGSEEAPWISKPRDAWRSRMPRLVVALGEGLVAARDGPTAFDL